jgi:hypothetical protein
MPPSFHVHIQISAYLGSSCTAFFGDPCSYGQSLQRFEPVRMPPQPGVAVCEMTRTARPRIAFGASRINAIRPIHTTYHWAPTYDSKQLADPAEARTIKLQRESSYRNSRSATWDDTSKSYLVGTPTVIY